MTWQLRSIESVGEFAYRVVLMRGTEERAFSFEVDDDGNIAVVQAEAAFYEFVGLQRPEGQQIYAAVSAFHTARHLTIREETVRFDDDVDGDQASRSTVDIFDKAEAVTTHAQFVEFADALVKDFIENQQEWENIKLEHFLDAIAAWSSCMDVVYSRAGKVLDQQSPWQHPGGCALSRANLRMTATA